MWFVFCCGCENFLQNHPHTKAREREREGGGEQREEKRGKEDGEWNLRGRS